MKKLLCVLMLGLVFGQDFTAFIKAESGGEFTYLTFGFNPDATDDFDDGLDEEAPNAPDTGFDAALEWGGDRYLTQILQGDDDYSTHEYVIRFQFPTGEDIILSWDNTGLSDAGTFIIQDIFGGFLGVNVNMVTETSVIIPASGTFSTLYLFVTPNDGAMIDNRAPYAHAGTDVSTIAGLTVQLDASESYDPDLDVLTYLWTSLNDITLSDANIVNPTFIAPGLEGEYEFSVIVIDPDGLVSDPDIIVVTVIIGGCTDETACNYDPYAVIDDGSCLYYDCLGECGGTEFDCGGGCDENVELWGECYNIETSTEINCGWDYDCPGLSGAIPPEIGYLVNLTSLNLDENQLTSIPESIGNLISLEVLILSGNQFTSIPESIGNLSSLAKLILAGNQITGEIPQEMGSLTNLIWLNLGRNQFDGDIPPEIGNLTNLTWLSLYDNQLTGEIPPEIGNLVNLTHLHLEDNELTGVIPESICDLNIDWSNEQNFKLYNNLLCPPYPECIEDFIGEQDTTNCSSMSISDFILPIIFELHEPFPNPFNPVVNIDYSIATSGYVKFAVYDLHGSLVTTLIDGNLVPSFYSTSWNADGYPSGLYFVKLTTAEFTQTQKIILLK